MDHFGGAGDLSTAATSLAWLAGLLEAEGSFLRPPPSAPKAPILVCRMTDLDVIQRVAAAFGVSVLAIDKGAYRTEYSARLKGAPCTRLMTALRPFMGIRRRAAIDRALTAARPPMRRLDYRTAQEIRVARATGAGVSSLACAHGVSRSTIRSVLRGEIYRAPSVQPWLLSELPPLGAAKAGLGLDELEIYWLAGWLEGEGSFLAPPPSDPRRPRVARMQRQRRDHRGGAPLRRHTNRAARPSRCGPRLVGPLQGADTWH